MEDKEIMDLFDDIDKLDDEAGLFKFLEEEVPANLHQNIMNRIENGGKTSKKFEFKKYSSLVAACLVIAFALSGIKMNFGGRTKGVLDSNKYQENAAVESNDSSKDMRKNDELERIEGKVSNSGIDYTIYLSKGETEIWEFIGSSLVKKEMNVYSCDTTTFKRLMDKIKGDEYENKDIINKKEVIIQIIAY